MVAIFQSPSSRTITQVNLIDSGDTSSPTAKVARVVQAYASKNEAA